MKWLLPLLIFWAASADAQFSPSNLFALRPARTTGIPTVDADGCAKLPPVSDYDLWFDSRDINGDGTLGEDSDGASVTTWQPRGAGASGFYGTQATANAKPIVTRSCVSSSSNWCVHFDGGDSLVTPSTYLNYLSDGTSNYTLYLAAVQDTSDGGSGAWMSNFADAGSGLQGMSVISTNGAFTRYYIGALATQAAQTTTSVARGTPAYLSTYLTWGTSYTKYINGISIGTVSLVAFVPGGTPCNMVIGASSASTCASVGQNMTGAIYQLIVFKRVLNSTERAAMDSWVDCLTP